MPLFAVGLTKDWVEVRVSSTPPEVIKSEVIRKIKLPKDVADPDSGYYGIERDLKIQVVYFDGGKVLCTVSRPLFIKLMREVGGEAPRTGTVTPLCPVAAEKLQDKLWRKAHHVR